LKGHVTNVEAGIMSAARYHDLWRVEQCFRMSKPNLAAGPMFHAAGEAIEGRLIIVFAALATPETYRAPRAEYQKIVQSLRPIQQITVRVADDAAADLVLATATAIRTALQIRSH
jgi:hypothetical protein